VPTHSDGLRVPEQPSDPIIADGSMWAHPLGESPGIGGMGLSGTGLGGGGLGAGIGLDHIGELGHGDGEVGPGTGGRGSPSAALGAEGVGWGLDGWSGRGALGGAHSIYGPQYRYSGSVVNSRIPPDTIQRIVRENFGRFRLCYERGLVRNATLAGRVITRFVIVSNGHVASATSEGSDLPDADVISCVTQAFSALTFPEEPMDSQVTVVYPIMFTPD
jgi:hypothetical protein